MKYVYRCGDLSNAFDMFTFEADEPLERGQIFVIGGHVYQVVEGPQTGVEPRRVAVRRLS